MAGVAAAAGLKWSSAAGTLATMKVLPADRADLGRFGEVVAASFLQERGAVVLVRNLESKLGEIDLIVAFGREVAAVEVRAARRPEIAPELVSLRKEQQVRRLAAMLDPPIFRVDLVTVLVQTGGVKVRWHPRV